MDPDSRATRVPAMTQLDSLAPLLTDCFTSRPDFTPYRALPAKEIAVPT